MVVYKHAAPGMVTSARRYCVACDVTTEWMFPSLHSKRLRCHACEMRKRSEAGKRAAATRKRKAEKRGRLGHGLVSYSKLLRQTDELWSVVCRAEASQCAMCYTPLPPEALQWAHHRPRGKPKWMRYHEDNWSALCAPCHRRHSPAGPEWYDWLRTIRLGHERYDTLNLVAQTRGRLGRQDLDGWQLLGVTRIDHLSPGDRRDWAQERMAKILGRF